MPPSLQSQLTSIIAEIDRTGHANVLRLTVLKKWFKHPGRRRAFGLWVAERAAVRGDAATGEAADLFALAQAVLPAQPPAGARPEWAQTERLYRRLRAFQNAFTRQQWGPVRIIQDHDLLLVEEGLASRAGRGIRPVPDLCSVAAPPRTRKSEENVTDGANAPSGSEDCAHYASPYGRDLNGPARDRLLALVGFVTTLEAGERGVTAGSAAARQASTG